MNAVVNIFKKYGYSFLVCSIILLGIFLRLKGLLDNPSLWHDECALAWNIKFKNYVEYFGQLRFFQITPPFFLVVTKYLVNILNVSNNIKYLDLLLRIIPNICGILSIFVFFIASKYIFNTKKSIILALVLFSVNPILIDYSYEFKPYMLDVFFTILLMLFFMKINIEKTNYKTIILEGLGLSLVIWFSLASVFMTAAGFIILGFKNKALKKIILLLSPVLISILLYLKFYVLNIYKSTGVDMVTAWNNDFITANFSNFIPLLINNLNYFFPAGLNVFLIIACILYGIILFIKEKKYIFLCLSLLTFIFLIMSSVLHLYPFSQRLIIFIIPIIIFLMVKPLDDINKYNVMKSLFIVIIFLLAFIPQLKAVPGRVNNINNKGEFPREMMEIISKNIKPNDIIFVTKSSRAEYCYYSSFYNFKNNVIYDNSPTPPDDKLLKSLKALRRGSYWFYLPYDYSPQRATNKIIENWTEKNTKIIYKTKATQSLLLYVNKK